MYLYLLHDTIGNFNGAYTELAHVYVHMYELWVELHCVDEDARIFITQRETDDPELDWLLYKIPVGEFEDVFIEKGDKGNEYNIEIPETYTDLKSEIRNNKINKIIE